jgi:SEC-C motif-containing protein
MSRDAKCRCRSGRKAKRCCAPYHEGRPAPTPEALMRSRFSAYALGLAGYIVDTTARGGPMWDDDLDRWRAAITRFSEGTRFLGLRIDDAPPPGPDEGFVTFTATLEQGGGDASFSERSRFLRQDGAWRYHSGERLAG